MPKLKVPSVASKPEKAAILHQHMQLPRPDHPHDTSGATPPPPVKRGPRMKSCVTAKERKLATPKLQNGLKANPSFKEVFGCSDDEVRGVLFVFLALVANHTPFFSLLQEDSFPGFSLKAVKEEYDSLVASSRAEGGRERGKEGRIGGKGERPRRLGECYGGHYLEVVAN